MKKEIVVNYLDDKQIFKIVPLTMQREWMHNSREKFAYKCLPLNIANQYGWTVLSPADFSVSWYGGNSHIDVEVFSNDQKFLENSIVTHFGEKTFTLQLDFIIKTPENYSLYIRGVPNKEYGILKPLDAIVETDWLPFTFTYNFKFMESGVVDFKKGDPLFCFFPIERNTVEQFNIRLASIEEDKQFKQDFEEYSKSRHNLVYSGKKELIFQKYYLNGRGPNKEYSIKNHIKRLFFKEVTDIIEE